MSEQAERIEPEEVGAVRRREGCEGAAFDTSVEVPATPWLRPQAGRSYRRPWHLTRAREWVAAQLAEESRHGQGFLWIPVAMAAGAAAELAAPRDMPLAALAGPLVLLLVLACVAHARGRRSAAFFIAASALFAGMTAAAMQVRIDHTTMLDSPVVTHLSGVVLAREEAGKSGWRYLIRISSTSDPVIRRAPERVRLVSRGQQAPIEPGQGIGGVARLLPPSGPVMPGGYDFGFNAYFKGIGAIGFFYGPPHRIETSQTSHPGPIAGLQEAVAEMRQAIDGRIRAVLPGENGALAAALVVAERGAIPEQTVAALRDAGLAHILAISGLHMVLVAGTVFLVLRFLLGFSSAAMEGLPVKKIAAVAALVVATAYLAISGVGVSTLRAWIMLAIVLVAVLLDRPALTLRNVALAAIVIVLTKPAAVVGPSFQMSFAATTALIAGYSSVRQLHCPGRCETAGRSLLWFALRFVGAIAFTSLIAGAATAIFAAYHFQRIATLGIVGNLLAMPLVTFIVMPMALLATLLMPYGLETWPLKLMGHALDVVIAISYKVQALGGAETTGRIPVSVLLLFLAGFVTLVLLRSRLRLVGLVAIVAALVLDVSILAPRRPDVLVSEDGRLVGLPMESGIATNSARPSSFVFGQWLTALAETRTIAPQQFAVSSGSGFATAARRTDKGRAAPDPQAVAAMRAALDRRTTGFLCYGRKWCAAEVAGGVPIMTVADLAFVGPACDLAAIVVVARPIRMTACRSGALLLTGRTLRRSGSVQIEVDRIGADRPSPPSALHRSRDGRVLPATTERRSAYRLTIRSALGGVIRPWSVQRYYDWRSRSFDFKSDAPNVQTLMITAD